MLKASQLQCCIPVYCVVLHSHCNAYFIYVIGIFWKEKETTKRKKNNKQKQTNKNKQTNKTNKQKTTTQLKTRLIKTQNLWIKSNLAKFGKLAGAIALFYLAIFCPFVRFQHKQIESWIVQTFLDAGRISSSEHHHHSSRRCTAWLAYLESNAGDTVLSWPR